MKKQLIAILKFGEIEQMQDNASYILLSELSVSSSPPHRQLQHTVNAQQS